MMKQHSRYTLVPTAAQAPGYDFLTKGVNGPFIDTGVTITKFDGFLSDRVGVRVYLSKDTIRELAQEAGIFEEEESKLLTRETEYYSEGYTDALKEEGVLLDVLDRLRTIADRLDFVRPLGDDSGETDPENLDTDASTAGEEPVKLGGKPKKSARQGSGSAGDKGPDDVPGSSSDESEFSL